MGDEAPKFEARLVEPLDGAGEFWWRSFVERHGNEISRRFKQSGIVYVNAAQKMPTDLFSYIREAGLSFSIARYLATIVLSSSAVELILNRDRRTKAHAKLIRTREGWATLNNQNLRISRDEGLPANALLSQGESLDEGKRIAFVERRNKVAHGEISDLVHGVADYDPGAEREALDQLQKADRFAVEWFNAAPDVQQCHIQNYRWP